MTKIPITPDTLAAKAMELLAELRQENTRHALAVSALNQKLEFIEKAAAERFGPCTTAHGAFKWRNTRRILVTDAAQLIAYLEKSAVERNTLLHTVFAHEIPPHVLPEGTPGTTHITTNTLTYYPKMEDA